MAFKSIIISEDWRSAVIISLYKVKERGLSIGIIEVLACKCERKNICYIFYFMLYISR